MLNIEIHEMLWADQYDEAGRKFIREQYIKRYTPKITPLTHPLNFDPCEPPEGWKYDPYYEMWVQI